MKRVLIANRGEIALRVIRACKDHGLESVAIYSEEDRDALHAKSADFSYSLNGTVAKDTYLNIPKIIALAKESGADAVHPGYGFLSENADFAQAVVDAGLIWVGPPPAAISALGDKVSARRIASAAGAPLVAGTKDPVTGHEEVLAFAKEHGLPVAIKAAFGGGGRGLKVARTMEEIPELYASAVREAIAGFGRGECFVERYLDKPRHVETQVLVDKHGHAVVVSTRDCSLQRRHQKLVEEAPAPFLTKDQIDRLYASSKAILKEVGYQGAGTCEFLVAQDGTISFLEVNTRLQVEHPVSEEVTGIDLVREQFRLAEGGVLDYADPVIKGHSFEFRINGEDAGRNFMPAPGPVHVFKAPSGPGVRVDTGVESGDVISGSFDSMVAKLIVTGATREEALARSRRALAEMEVAGLPTVLPFHRKIVNDPAFIGDVAANKFGIYTRWIETEWINDIPAWTGVAESGEEPAERNNVVVEVDGKRIEVSLPKRLLGATASGGVPAGHAPKRKSHSHATAGGGSGNTIKAPMQSTVVKIAVAVGETVAEGDLVVVLEAMKMEQPINAHRAGKIKSVTAEVGTTVPAGTVLLEIED